MKLPWQSDFERTCTDCGHSWHVPRGFARAKVQAVGVGRYTGSTRGQAMRDVQAQVHSGMAKREQADAFRRCASCGSDNFSQRRANGS
jgi:hypothetical protein